VFDTSTNGYLHTQAVGIQDIRTLVPIVVGVTSTQYPRWRDLVLLMLQHYALDDHVSSDAPTLEELTLDAEASSGSVTALTASGGQQQ
jgi:hypothetical protein